MKIRKFYPRQVIRKLNGEHAALNGAQAAVLRFALLRGRKLGYSMMITPSQLISALAAAMEVDEARMVLPNCTTRIFLSPSI